MASDSGDFKKSLISLVFWNRIIGLVISLLMITNLVLTMKHKNEASSDIALITIRDYAKMHNISHMEVRAAIAEGRLKPEAFPVRHKELPETMEEGDFWWLVQIGAKIEPRIVSVNLPGN